MADQNESNNNKGMNTFADDIDFSPHLTEMERIGARASRKGIQRTQLEERMKERGKFLNSLIDQGRETPDFRQSPFYKEQTGALREDIRGIRKSMNTLDNTARSRAESEASTYIARQFSPSAINKQTSSMQKEAATQNRAFSMSGQSYDQLEAQREDVLANIRVRERQAQNEVKGMFTGRGQVDPEKSAAVGVMMGGTQEQLKQLATINAAQAFQRASGMDPNAKMKNLGEMGQAANSLLSAQSIAQEVRSGGVQIAKDGKMGTVANKDVNAEIINQARALSQALKELAEGAGKTDEELGKLRKTADESADNMKKLQDAQKAGAGSGGWNGAQVANALAGGFSALGSGAQQLMVNQRMGQVANIAGYAGEANSQYDMYTKARGGDVASQLALSQLKESSAFGDEMAAGTNVALGAYGAGGVAQMAAGGFQVAEGLKDKGTGLIGGSLMGTSGTATTEVLQGGQNLIQGGVTTAVAATDMAKGISSGAARLAGNQAQRQAKMALNAIPAQQMQGLRNFYTDLDVAGQQMGSKSNSFIEDAGSSENLKRMGDARLSPEQFAKLSGAGAAMMGSTFDTSQVYASRNLEQRGFGTSSENMQRMATLAGAGANNPKEGMESVLSAAVSKGLDSSKSIGMMVDNTASMVAGNATSTAAGISTVASSASLLSDSIDPNQKNKEFAVQRAMTALEVAKNVTTDTSVSYTGMVNTARIDKTTGIGGSNALFAAGMSTAELKGLQGMDEAAAKDALLKQGVNIEGVKGGAKGFVSTMLKNQTNQMFTGSGALAFGTNEIRDSLSNKALAGKGWNDLSTAEKDVVGKIGKTSGVTGEEYFNTAAGINKPVNKGDAGKNMTSSPGDPGDLKSQMDALRTSGFKQLTEAASLASTELGGFKTALKAFNDLQKQYEEGGMQNEKDFAGSAAKMANDFSAVAVQFTSATTTYAEASVAMKEAAAALRSNGIPMVPNAVTDGLNKLKGSTR